MKHTQGKWTLNTETASFIEQGGANNEATAIIASNVVIALLGEVEEKQANAKLIAAAPELLEALRTILEENTHLELNLNGVELGESAIASATE